MFKGLEIELPPEDTVEESLSAWDGQGMRFLRTFHNQLNEEETNEQ